MDIYLFVSAMIQIFKFLFKAMISSSEIEERFEKDIVHHLDNVKKGNENSWRHNTFYNNYAEQSRTQKNKSSKLVNLTN